MSMFKNFLHATYFTLLDATYNIDMPCTWFFSRNCPRSQLYLTDFIYTLLCTISN